MVGWRGLAAAQRLSQAAVEVAEAPQAGYELPGAVKGRKSSTLKDKKDENLSYYDCDTHTHTHQQGRRSEV